MCVTVNVCVFGPQIAALKKAGDSFPLIAASGKVLGKVKDSELLTATLLLASESRDGAEP